MTVSPQPDVYTINELASLEQTYHWDPSDGEVYKSGRVFGENTQRNGGPTEIVVFRQKLLSDGWWEKYSTNDDHAIPALIAMKYSLTRNYIAKFNKLKHKMKFT